jgi:hypothetical protein
VEGGTGHPPIPKLEERHKKEIKKILLPKIKNIQEFSSSITYSSSG